MPSPYPAHYPPSFPLYRSLVQAQTADQFYQQPDRALFGGQQINFESVSRPDENLMESLKISRVNPTLFPSQKADLAATEKLTNVKIAEFSQMNDDLGKIIIATNELASQVAKTGASVRRGSEELDADLMHLLSLKNKAVALGITRI